MKAYRSFVRLKLVAETSQDLNLLDQIVARLQEGKALSSYSVDGETQGDKMPGKSETKKERK